MSAHWPVVARITDGRWGVFCADCSQEPGEYVYPCARGWDAADHPPPILVADTHRCPLENADPGVPARFEYDDAC